MTRPDLTALLERVEGATGPDRGLERDIALALDKTGSMFVLVPRVTESIDAAVGLVERVLPRWSLSLNLSEGLRYPVVTMGRSYPTNKSVAVEHRTPPLAILAALLRSLLAQEADDGR